MMVRRSRIESNDGGSHGRLMRDWRSGETRVGKGGREVLKELMPKVKVEAITKQKVKNKQRKRGNGLHWE